MSEVALVGPDVELSSDRVYFAGSERTLLSAVLSLANEIGAVTATASAAKRGVAIGLLSAMGSACDYYLTVDGWIAGITPEFTSFRGVGTLPFAPYAAACMAAGEVFKLIRIKPELQDAPSPHFYSLWSSAIAADTQILQNGPDAVQGPFVDMELGGCGAVGLAFAATWWAIPGIRTHVTGVDGDKDGIDSTNLNRYFICGRSSVEKDKPSELQRILQRDHFKVTPVSGYVGQVRAPNPRPTVGICALDNNIARQAFMKRYYRRMYRGSTSGLRAEIVVAGPPGEGQCLVCDLVTEAGVTQEDEILRFKRATPEEKRKWCLAAGVTLEEAEAWVASTKCSTVGDQLITAMKGASTGAREFSVSFVSTLCGVLLAARVYQDLVAQADRENVISYQFRRPNASVNRRLSMPRNTSCTFCAPGSVEADVWSSRYHAPLPDESQNRA